MRYVAYEVGGERLLGARLNGELHRLGPMPSDAGSLPAEAAKAASAPVETREHSPAMPYFPGARVICLGLNYVDHAKEGGMEPPDYPAFFFRVDSSLAANGAEIPMPRVSTKMDYEAELLVVIGKGGKDIPEDSALDHVLGYSVFNDVSLRDFQRKGGQWTPGKNFDGTGIVGDEIVTPDEVNPGATGLGIRSVLNGKVMQDANTDDMIFSVARSISLASEFMTLRPGDLIAMGTPSGVGFARKPPVWMGDGDEIRIEIDGVGSISNRVSAANA